MARQLFLQPHLSPTIEKLERYEFAKIWASTSYHLSLQLALHQAVRIPGIGTFAVVTKRVALSEQDLVIVERPVFQPEKAVAQDRELRCACTDFPGNMAFPQRDEKDHLPQCYHSPEQTRTSLSLELAHEWHPVPRTTPRCCSEEPSPFPFLEDAAGKRLLRRARLPPHRLPALTVTPEQGQKAEGSEPRARQLPVIQRSCLKEKEEKGKLPPLVAPREVDFIARAIERREKNKRQKKKEEKLPQYIQKFLEGEEKKKKEAAQ
ncbi:uncharacterized protein [Patagioenas fasciata]|uniref:uncharacterized protein n=1 Tax=Patagioenas fasciata TaxID=372321 RepID=UPI003A99326F